MNRTVSRRLLLPVALPAAVLAGLALPGTAQAATGHGIVYSETFTGSGTLGSTSFSGAKVTVSFAGNTSSVSNAQAGVPTNSTGTVTVTVAGVGSGTVTGTPFIADNQSNNGSPAVDIGKSGAGVYLSNPALSSYDLTSQVGPLSGPVSYRWGFSTTAGGFRLTSASTGTFTAVFTS